MDKRGYNSTVQKDVIKLWWIWCLIGIIGIVLAVVFLQTILLRPTKAATATLPACDPKRAQVYAETLSKMVQCETVSYRDQKDVTKFIQYQKQLEALFPHVFSTCEKYEFEGSFLLKWKGQGLGDPILLMSHQDVVQAEGTWKYEPFSGKIADGAVWGRGTVDTKGSQFCFLQAAEELIEQGYIPQTDVYLAGSCTEEWSGPGAAMTAAWLKDHNVHLSLLLDEGGMILSEPMAGVKGIYGMVGVVEKGYGDVKFVAKGNGGHASCPGKKTPWARLAAFVNEVEHHDPFRSEYSPAVREMFKRLAPNMNFGMKLVFANLWLFGPLLKKLMPSISPAGAAMLKTTLAFTKGKGSEGYNVLPQEAYITGNMRFIQHQPTEESIALIAKLAKKYEVETQVITKEAPCKPVPYDGKPFRLVEQAMEKVYPGVGVSPYVMTGGTDAKEYDIVCDHALRFAPLYINQQQYESIHALNENLNCSALPPAVDFYRYIIEHANIGG